LEILYEDNHIVAVNKSVSDIVQQDKSGDEALDEKLKSYIRERDKKPGNVFLGVCHRIDRPVTGVVLFAKTSKALTRLNKMFKTREIQKIYWAVVKQEPPAFAGELEHHLARNKNINKSLVRGRPGADTKYAHLSYKLIGKSNKYFLLEIELHTGRHHQIRAQLAHIGCPIRGDLKYGYPRSNKNGGISLHARSIWFIHPVSKKEIYIEAPVPEGDVFSVFTV